MRGRLLRGSVLLAILLLVPVVASGATVSRGGADTTQYARGDDRPHPLGVKQAELKAAAIEAKLNGKAKGKVHQVARGQYVDLAREGQGMVWTVLGDFADLPHNSLPEPDRAVNNTSIWVPDFGRDYFNKLLYSQTPGENSMANFYLEQSSGRYTVAGDTTDWVTVPGNGASYDDGDPVGPSNGPAVWQFLIDSCDGWYDAQIAAGKTPAQIAAYLAQFDVYDRYDYDGDGNFNEPDGYIDTFQSVHAGEGNEAGGGVLGDYAIWSHSWYAYSSGIGINGPAFNKAGGIRVGNSDFWVGDYTIQPENGGVGVFVHEYGHDLGLPDLYDTSGGENGTGFWTLMSSGSWLDDGKDTIGNKAGHMGAWEKFQLGWLNYQVGRAGEKAEFKLGPMETNTKQAQGLFVILPKKAVTSNIGAPYAGANYYYSGAGDSLNSYMYKSFELPAGATLAAKVKYNIELDWDYAYVVVSTDNGATWTPVTTNLSTATNPNGQNFGNGITGASAGWVDLTANLPAGNVLVGFRYWTDSNTGGFGFMVDDINITGYPTDGAETDCGLDVHACVRLPRDERHRVGPLQPLLRRGVSPVLRLRQDAADRPVLLRLHEQPTARELGRPLPLSRRPADQLLGHVAAQQPDPAASRQGPPPADRRSSLGALPRRRRAVAKPHPELRLDLLLRQDGCAQASTSTACSRRSQVFRASPSSMTGSSYYDPANPQGSVMNPNTGTQLRIQSISARDGFMQVQVAPVK